LCHTVNEELVGWILSFGSQVRVIQPEALRQKLREEAKRIVGSSV
jgi:predicted DNA-binding transcriptional regulator YafY